ncbi:transglutaminase domain-containing protein, partial [Halobium palmae]
MVDDTPADRLSPEVRFTVESEDGHYWGTAAYDRYTGSGWVRTGEAEPYESRLAGPPGEDREIRQRVTAKDRLNSVPSAWKPVEVDGSLADRTEVTGQGFLRPTGTLRANESYTVVSEAPEFTEEDLRESDDDYPALVEEAYLQLPESTSDRVRERAAEVTAGESSTYDEAVAVEAYLESNKQYSLTVDKPEGDVADAFLFEMESGYCVYYATTMVVMLRSEGIPARFVTGYTSGQRVSEDGYVVRGLDSHAWVQVYFPETGWVNFDPTPGGPRESAENARIEEARRNDAQNVDTDGSEGGEYTTPAPETATTTTATQTTTTTTANTSDGNGSNGSAGGEPTLPGNVPTQGSGFAGNGS